MTDEQILQHFEMPGLNLEATLDAHDLGLLLTGIRALLSASKPAATMEARRAALEESAAAVEKYDVEGREWVPHSLWGQITKEAAARIRALASVPTMSDDSAIIDADIDMGRAVRAATVEVSLDPYIAATPERWTEDQIARAWFDGEYGHGHTQAPGYVHAFLKLLAASPAAPAQPGEAVADVPEGCTVADAKMLREANHALTAENELLRKRLRPFAHLVGIGELSWAMVKYCVKDDPEKQTFQAPQMQRAFNRAAEAYRNAAPQPSQPAKAGEAARTHYEALEREHLGDPDKRTGIYATKSAVVQGDELDANSCRYEVKYTPVVGEPFWAEVTFKEYEDSRMNGSPVRCVMPPCQGMNCGCTDGASHSPECQAEHAAAVAGGTFVNTAQSAVVLDDERAGFEAWGNETFNYGFHPETWDDGVGPVSREPHYEHEGTQMAWEGWQARAASTQPVAQTEQSGEPDMKALVNRFLAWPLPQTVCADGCATNSSYAFPRSGTSLLNADEAEAMLRHVLAAHPAQTERPLTDERPSFEAAWRQEYPLHGETTFKRSGFNPDAYVNTRVQDGWLMWQARAKTGEKSAAAHPASDRSGQ